MRQLRSIVIALLISHSTHTVFANTDSEDWSTNLGTPIFASPLLRDLDSDGDLEILISSLIGEVSILDHNGAPLSGWPRKTALFQRTSPNVGDIDGDGSLDVVVGDNDGMLHAWELDGTVKTGFPIQLEGSIKSIVRLVDFDGDKQAEILIHTGASRLYLLNGQGQDLPGWPIDLGGDEDKFGSWMIASTPTVVDFNFDGALEIAVGTTQNNVQVFNLDGTSVDGWPATTSDWVYPSITAVDLDGDYELELVAGSGDGKVYAWASDGSSMPGFPIDLGEPIVASIATADTHSSAGPELFVADLSGKVYCYSSTGILQAGWPQSAKSGIVGSPIIIDANADGLLDVLVPSRDNNIHIWTADGRKLTHPTLTATDWIEATPAAGDLDGDGFLEVLYASYDGYLYQTQLNTAADRKLYPSASFRGDLSLQDDLCVGDCDQDSLPDQLELDAFNSLAYSGSDDSDYDGSSNLDEWISGTDPTSANDCLRVEMIVYQGQSGPEPGLRWEARAGRRYQVMATHSLSPGKVDWQPTGNAIVATTTEIIDWYPKLGDSEKRCFYSITVSKD